MSESIRQPSAQKNQTTILIIDDELAIRQSYTDYLEDLDYRILTAENRRIGLEIFAKNSTGPPCRRVHPQVPPGPCPLSLGGHPFGLSGP